MPKQQHPTEDNPLSGLMIEEGLNLDEISLPKWTKLRLVGRRVSPELAGEIILRTTHSFFTNDRGARKQIDQMLGMEDVPGPKAESPEAESPKAGSTEAKLEQLKAMQKRDQAVATRLRSLPAPHHINNAGRIATALFGGPRFDGVVDWDGRVHSVMNIGKSPYAAEVAEDLLNLVRAFPDLDFIAELQEQSVFQEDCETAQEAPRRFIQFRGQAGQLTATLPRDEDWKDFLELEREYEASLPDLRSELEGPQKTVRISPRFKFTELGLPLYELAERLSRHTGEAVEVPERDFSGQVHVLIEWDEDGPNTEKRKAMAMAEIIAASGYPEARRLQNASNAMRVQLAIEEVGARTLNPVDRRFERIFDNAFTWFTNMLARQGIEMVQNEFAIIAMPKARIGEQHEIHKGTEEKTR